VETAKKLTYKKDGRQIYGLSFDQIGRPYQLLPLAQSLGAIQFASADGLQASGYTNSPQMVKAAQFYYDTFNTWNISPKISADDALGYFTGGQVAMFITGPWQIPAYQEAGMDFGFAPHPYFKDSKIVTPTGSWCVGVNKYSKKIEAAAKFVEWLTTDNDACQLNYNIGKNLPCNLSVLKSIENDSAYDIFPNNSMKLAVYESINTAMGRPQLAGYAEWQAVMEKTYSDIMNGTNPQVALDIAVIEIDNQLKKYQR
jgi:multiple sugar transport system substrate-binding protein